MKACIYVDNLFYEHKPWFPHPESPARLERLLKSIRAHGLMDEMKTLSAPRARARRELALLVHSDEYVRLVEKAAERGWGMLDPDTYVSPKTVEAALAVLASVEDAVERLRRGDCSLAIVAGRPPGHHAGVKGAAMGAPTLGFCIFNASALASLLLSGEESIVLHVDFDLHHGNGTQEIHYSNGRVIHVDIHQDPSTIYPGTGWPWQIGEGEGRGTKINIVLPAGSCDDVFIEAVDKLVEIVDSVSPSKPRYLVFSAGFDGYSGDGLGGLRLTSNSYYYIASRLVEEYETPVLVVWEGGYSLGLERGAPAFIAGLLGHDNPVRDEKTASSEAVTSAFKERLKELTISLGLHASAPST